MWMASFQTWCPWGLGTFALVSAHLRWLEISLNFQCELWSSMVHFPTFAVVVLPKGGSYSKTRWWFQTFFIFIPTWGNDPIWLIFLKWVETTNQKSLWQGFFGGSSHLDTKIHCSESLLLAANRSHVVGWVGWVLTVGRYRVGQLHQALPMMIQEVEVFGTQYEDFCAGWPVALLMV